MSSPCDLDALELHPERSHLAGPGALEGQRYVASGYWYWDDAVQDRDVVRPDVLFVSGVPAFGHLYLRGLALDGVALRAALRAFLGRQRTAWGLAPLPFERYTDVFGPDA